MRSLPIFTLVNRRHLRAAHRQKSLRQRTGRVGLAVGMVILLAFSAGILLAGVAYANLTADLPSTDFLQVLLNSGDGLLLQPTRIYDRTGQHELAAVENAGVQRRFLPIDPQAPEHLSPRLVQVMLARLEPDFWESPGFRADQLTNPQPQTIAERLVDIFLLWKEPASTNRSLRMRLLAGQVVARFGRTQVLEWMLNGSYYGHMAYGADTASRLYLGKQATDLSLAESALLMAAFEAPALNPIDAPQAAMDRQQAILKDLFQRGLINQKDYQGASKEELRLQPAPSHSTELARGFTTLVLDQLSHQFDRSRLERGGLRIITSLDFDLQTQVVCSAHAQLSDLEGKPRQENPQTCPAANLLPSQSQNDPRLASATLLKNSAVIIDPSSGEILAYLADSSLNGEEPVMQSHEPGSLLTPFVALAGFARGQGPASLVWDIPGQLPEDLAGRANPDGRYRGPLRLRSALANDVLVPLSLQLVEIGPSNLNRLANLVGIPGITQTTNPDDLLFAGGSATPLEIAQAYGILAAQGLKNGQIAPNTTTISPAAVLEVIQNNGERWIVSTHVASQAVLSQPLAYLVHHILSDEPARWPSLGFPNPLEIGRPAGAKIGQLASGQSGWSAGYTPQRVVVTWLGLDPSSTSGITLDAQASAGLWHALIQYASSSLPVEGWSAPPGITTRDVCDPSGQLPTAACPAIVNEIFLTGNEPTGPDTLYKVFQVNRETGKLATVFTPPELVEDRTYLVVPTQAQEWALSAGLPIVPTDYDLIQAPIDNPDVHISNPAIFSFISKQVTIRGSAGGTGFKTYRLQVGQGINPQTWLQIGQDSSLPVTNGILGTWDTSGIQGLYALRLQVVRSDSQVDSATIQVTIDNLPPEVHLLYPSADSIIDSHTEPVVTLQVDARDDVGLAKVEWWLDGNLLAERTEPQFAYPWQATQGIHTLEVRADDLAGNAATSQSITFTVK